MNKLVITATTDSTGSYSRNPYLTPCSDAKGVAQEYIRTLEMLERQLFTRMAPTLTIP